MGMMFHRYAERRREKEKQILAERAKQTKKVSVKAPKQEDESVGIEIPAERPVRELGDFRREPKRRGRKSKS